MHADDAGSAHAGGERRDRRSAVSLFDRSARDLAQKPFARSADQNCTAKFREPLDIFQKEHVMFVRFPKPNAWIDSNPFASDPTRF